MSSGLVVIEKEMAVTHKDFFRSLPNALQDEEYSVDGYSVRISGANGFWNIELGLEGTRNIAHLSLPRTKVKLIFKNYSKIDLKNILERFDRAFQRAGG